MEETYHSQAEISRLRQRCAELERDLKTALELLRIANGQSDFRPATCIADEICHNSLQAVKELANHRHLSVAFAADPAGVELVADAHDLEQMLVSLLTFAAHATPQGARLALHVRGAPEDNQVLFSVTAKTMNAPQPAGAIWLQALPPLDQAISPTAPDLPSYLDLMLVRRLAELHGGIAGSDRTESDETTYWIALPWQTAPHSQSAAPGAAETPGSADTTRFDVLLVEDNEVNAEIVADFLASAGFAVTLAGDGLDALQKVERMRPDLILMDIHMPGMDGIEAIRRIRQHADPRIAATPIIALTALAMASDRERCLAAGASDYVSKPVSLRELLGVIHQHLPTLPASGDQHV